MASVADNEASPPRPARAVPIILQGEPSECGLACLAMVASSWGLEADLAALRTKLTTTPRGLSLRMLMSLAGALGLAARPVRIGLHRLGDLKTPAILHWNMDHFVVLEKLTGDVASIVDPARGRVRMKIDAVSPSFTGIAVELTPTNAFSREPLALSRSFRRAWFEDPHLRSVALRALWLTVLLQASIVSLPFAYRSLIDRHPAAGTSDPAMLAIVAGIALMIVVQAGASWTRGVLVTRFGNLFVHRVSAHIVGRLFSLPVSFFQRQILGDVLARVRSVDAIRRFVTDRAIPLLIDLAVSVVTAALMIRFSPKLAAIVILGLAIETTMRFAALPRQRELSDELLHAEGKELARLLESIRAVQAIKLAGREAQRFALWENDLVRVLNANMRLSRLHTGVESAASTIGAVEWVLVLGIGVLGVGADPVPLGTLFGFLAYRGVFRERFGTLTENLSSLQLVGVHLRRLDDLMLAEAEPVGGRDMPVDGAGALSLKNVRFRYAATEPLVLDDVSLEVPAGACVAIVGPSGSGKSTLIKLILGIETPSEGDVLLDDASIRDVHRHGWRERFGTVMQDDTLLAGSIAENIAFFDATIDMDRVRAAARDASIAEEIEAMPMEYGTLVGDMGAQISGGQRQRILIARALYRQPKIILFDEGTANLDAENETRIAAVLATLAPTRIVVAHRSHLVQVADIVYEVRGGRVTRMR
ncbi:MAG TPA: peptidase domain-containing ABC transporter [Polyangium sp.]|nr:peptidase domain-containing ABC transporter [Polyangium sp.]